MIKRLNPFFQRKWKPLNATIDNVQYVSPLLCCDPWKSNETVSFVRVIVPETEDNLNPQQELEDEELIVVELLDMNNLMQNITELCERKGYGLCAKIYMFAKGIKDSQR